jgi:uncharacterized protein YjcR
MLNSNEIRKLKESGTSWKNLAKKYSCSVNAVRQAAKKAGYIPGKQRMEMAEKRLIIGRRIKRLAEANVSWVRIAEKFNCTIHYARSAASKAGYVARVHVATEKEIAKAKKMFDTGKSFEEKGAYLGRSALSARNMAVAKGWRPARVVPVFDWGSKNQAIARKMLAEGKKVSDIADYFGISFCRMRNFIWNTSWYKKQREERIPFFLEESEKARNLFYEGKFLKEIARDLGRKSIRLLAKRYGWLHEIEANPKHRSGQYKLFERRLRELGVQKDDYFG